MSPAFVLEGSYDHRLLAFSLVIAFLASYTAIDMASRVIVNRGLARVNWLLGGSFAMGSGIWCMHFTGMLAFRLPLPVYYDLSTGVVSLLAAMAVSGIALYVVSRPRMTRVHLVLGSVLMGAGIATMHYTGMTGMRLQAMHYYDHTLWALSIVLAVIISFSGLLLIYESAGEKHSRTHNLGAAFALGSAISLTHYVGMAAVHFVPSTMPQNFSHSFERSGESSSFIFGMTLLVLLFARVTSLMDRRFFSQLAMLESEREMLRALIDNIPDLMYVKDSESRFVVANRQVVRSLGAESHEELIGKTESDFLPSSRANDSYVNEQRVVRSGEALFNHEEVVLDGQGNQIPVLTTVVPLHDSKGHVNGIVGVGRNLSERKQGEEALAAAERKYRDMFDQALFGIFQVDAEGHLLNLNQAMANILLYTTPEEMLKSLTGSLWTQAVLPERNEEFLSAMKEFGHVRAFELEFFRKDGTKIWISATVRAMMNDDMFAGFEGMFEDITERRSLRDQLLQAQKLESVGQLAAGIAHEINTPTQYIGDNIRFLKESFAALANALSIYGRLWQETCSDTLTSTSKEEMAAALKKIDIEFLVEEIPQSINDGLEGVTRVSSLVSAMKEFSHPGTKEKVALDLNHAIQSTITVARNEWKYVAEMETHFEPALPLVRCLPGEFNQVILNLIVNAAQAISDRSKERNGEKGKITVQTACYSTGVEIRIGDTGGGIPPEIQTKIFDPFFTTKEIGKGTGQGLAIARSVVVDKHNGSIEFETVLGEGTTFIIRLPHMDQASVEELVFA